MFLPFFSGIWFCFSLFGETRRLSLARCVRFLQPAGSEATTDGRRCTADFFAAGAAAAAGTVERMLLGMWPCGGRRRSPRLCACWATKLQNHRVLSILQIQYLEISSSANTF